MHELNLKSNQELATFCGVSPGLVTQWFSGLTKLGPKPLRAFARTQFSLDWITEGRLPKYRKASPTSMSAEVENGPDILGNPKRIPIVGRVQAGPDGLLHVDDYHASHPDGFMLWWATCESTYALRIRGESMSPRYLPGEFVGVDPCSEVNPNDEVIVLLKSGQRLIKRLLWNRDGQACFESVNKNFQNIIIDMEDLEGMHLVIGNIPKSAFRSI